MSFQKPHLLISGKYWIILLVVLVIFSVQAFESGHKKDDLLSSGHYLSVQKDTIPKKWPATFGFGRTATVQEIAKIDIDVRPDGTGLPAGSGNVAEGKLIYQAKCLACHGATQRTVNASLIGPALITDTTSKSRAKTIGNYWPYATTVFDYINRAMPYNAPGSLTSNEVYSLTAYLLNANRIIKPDLVINAKTLPKVVMPAQKLYIPDDRRGGPEVR